MQVSHSKLRSGEDRTASSFGSAEVDLGADSRLRALLESTVPAFATECLTGGADSLEESPVDQGMTR